MKIYTLIYTIIFSSGWFEIVIFLDQTNTGTKRCQKFRQEVKLETIDKFKFQKIDKFKFQKYYNIIINNHFEFS